jgi:glycosyltransferase involved in cell wall biosynthesis
VRIALAHPTYWPEVRRGSERLVHDLGVALARRGHEVTVLTSQPGRTTVTEEDGVEVVRSRRLPQPPTLGLHERFLGNVHNVVRQLIRRRFDLVHAFYPSDAWAALGARRLGGPPLVFSFNGIPIREFLVARRYRLEMLAKVVAGAEECLVLSEAAAEVFERYLLRRPMVLPGGVDAAAFAVDAPRAEAPTILCAASLGDPRKRGELLAAAFARLRSERPEVRLECVRTPDPHYGTSAPQLPRGAEWVDAASTDELARRYARASASVMPAPDEAFGLVLVESLAAGTPVAAPRSGGCPEIVDSRAVGRLFEPDDEAALAGAMDEALDLGASADTATACRARAADFDWREVAGRYEGVYEAALADAGGT